MLGRTYNQWTAKRWRKDHETSTGHETKIWRSTTYHPIPLHVYCPTCELNESLRIEQGMS